MPKILQFVCEHCANYCNGRITHRHKEGFISDVSLDGKLAVWLRTPPSKQRKCSECRKSTEGGWRQK